MNMEAHIALINYFSNNLSQIEKGFDIISPTSGSIGQLKSEIHTLQSKNWEDILK
jgi:hypothetical protein